jgi:DNA (cytosine-5)-methyltransferase 1
MDEPRYVVRRITPVEAERLQGFPDGWTDVEFKGKPAPDTARYKALGNSMTVNVMEWIAKRILMVEKGEL